MIINFLNRLILALIPVFLYFSCVSSVGPKTTPQGSPESTKTNLLEAGAQALQTKKPAEQLSIYLVGLHPMKEDPSMQLEAHHFCKQVNEDFAQCALYDGNTEDANLNGIEYIISEKLFNKLPEDEKQYWHPHNFEILSGQLVAPGLPDAAEKELMKKKMNSYGKTYHLWDTGHFGHRGDKLPLGEPKLAWSFNREGEALSGLLKQMEERTEISVEKTKKKRKILVKAAQPQVGVDALKGKFKGKSTSIEGVVDAGKK